MPSSDRETLEAKVAQGPWAHVADLSALLRDLDGNVVNVRGQGDQGNTDDARKARSHMFLHTGSTR